MGPIARITSKGQTTIPVEIRKALAVGPGDLIAWELLGNGRAAVHRVTPLDLAYLRAIQGTLSEWNTPEDEEAFRDL
jgi:bifunctional DNA-binding transcriptional regulator/antitoxin component of YhaV-PrlF toxin-antitoxin module